MSFSKFLQPSVWSSYFIDLSPEEMVQNFSKKGWSNSEFSDEHAIALLERGRPEIIGAEFKKFAQSYGVSFSQGHLRLRSDIAGENKEEDVEILKKWLDLFNAIGIRNAVLHPGGFDLLKRGCEPERVFEANVESIGELTKYIEGSEMTICLENIVQTAPECDDLLNIINAVGDANLGICLDTGHLNRTSGKQLEFIRKAGAYLKALHIDDNEGKDDQHMMPYGKGTVKWDEVLAGLKEVEYNRLFNFEIPGENNCPLDIRLAKLDYLKEIAAIMLKKVL